MKSKYGIIALVVVILAACGVALYFSLTKHSPREEPPLTVWKIARDGHGGEIKPPADNGEDKPPTGNGEVKPPDGNGEIKPPDNHVEPPKITPEDELLNQIYFTQKRLVSFNADIVMTIYGIRNEAAGTDLEKRLKGETSQGKFIYKPGNKFFLDLDSGERDQRYYGYMQTMWIVTESDGKKRAERWLIDEERLYEVLMLLEGGDPAILKKHFEVKLLDAADPATNKALLNLGYGADELPPRSKERREFLRMIPIDPSTKMEYARVDMVVGYKTVAVPVPDGEPKNETVPVIEKVKLYGQLVFGATLDNPQFKQETIIWFDVKKLDLGGGEHVGDEVFRFNPAAEKITDLVDHVMAGLGGVGIDRVEGVLGRMQRTPSFIVGVSAAFKSDKRDLISGQTVREGHLWFSPPQNFKLELTSPDKIVFAGNSLKAYEYRPDEKKATVYDLVKRKKEGRSLPGNFELYMLLVRQAMYELKSDFDFTLKPELEKIDSADCFHLELKRKSSQLPPDSKPKMEYADKIDLWVEVETFLTTRVRVTEKMPGKSEEITLSKTETERAIDPKLFEVPVFPPDVAVDEK